MHELAITQEIVRIAEEHARREKGQRVTRVIVEIGDLSGVVPEAVSLCFEACARDSLAEGAELVLQRVQGRGVCLGCREEVNLEAFLTPCPACGGYAVRPTAGRELRVLELEVA